MRRFFLGLLNALALLLFAAAVFCGAAWLFARHLDFPAELHPDEPGKVTQLIENDRNYFHPQLMLETTLLLMRHEQTPLDDRHAIILTGRRASAYLSAGAVALLALAGYFAAGWAGAVCVAVTTGLCPALLAHSRYLKEEPSLIFGIAACCFGAAVMSRLRKTPALIAGSMLVGVGCGLAASGKYAGAVMVVPALAIVAATTWRRWWLSPLCVPLMLAAAVVTWGGVNYRAVANWKEFKRGFEYERAHALEDSRNVTMAKPNAYFVDMVRDDAMPHIKVLAVLSPLALLMMRRRAPADRVRLLPEQHRVPYHRRRVWPGPPVLFGWWLIGTTLLYAAAISYSVLPFYRYALPVTVLLHAACGLGIVWLARWVGRPRLPAVAVGGAVLIIAGVWQGTRCHNYDWQFANDSRIAVRAWAKANLPALEFVVSDGYVHAQINRRRFPDKPQPPIPGIFFAADAGSVESLKRRGVRHVAVCGTSYERYTSPHTFGVKGETLQFAYRAWFYHDLFANYPIVWQQRAKYPMRTFTNPDIMVFRLDAKRDGSP